MKYIRRINNFLKKRLGLKWHISPSKKSFWSKIPNSFTADGYPGLKRIYTKRGIRYLIEGRKGFISKEEAMRFKG